ncbi:MAG: DUF362 domain-containing protein [Treponema sp.]|jgi:uncharacterized protein (DUF362 family)|nr:DUF362 domain-containing protein [Treponema sp.]
MEKNEILVAYGSDIGAMATMLAREARLAELIGERGKRIGLKPNLVLARPASGGATTHPEIVAALIAYLKENGFNNLAIIEGAWAGGSTVDAFSVCGYNEIAKRTGVPLIDTKRDKAQFRDCSGMKIEICESALAVDFMINLPVMKGHCQTLLTCALKNNKGIIPDREKRRFHTIGLHQPIAHLNAVARNDFILVDGICGDLDFEEGGNPVYAGRLFAARDPVLCDAWAAAQMGYAVSEIPYIVIAEKLGIGSADIKTAQVRELNCGNARPSAGLELTGKARQFAAYVNADNACSPCYASLIFALCRMDKNELNRIREKICVGQGFKGKGGPVGGPAGKSLGVGQCASGFKAHCPGCPPSGAAILDFLRGNCSSVS